MRLKHVLEFSTGWTPPTNDASSFEGDNRWANISDLGERVVTDTAKRISNDAVASAGIKPAEAGNLLYSFKLSIGQVSFAGAKMYTNEAIATFSPSDLVDLRFAYYALPFLLEKNAAENIYGAKLLNQALIRSALLLIPPLREQVTVADFLDRETAKIDALVAEQERLIALLKEKRQAVISHAVTKGLNPDEKMVDSGSPWIGQVPAHWGVARLRYVSPQITVGIVVEPSKYYVDEGVPALRSLNIRPGKVVLNNLVYLSESSNELLGKSKLFFGDIVAVRTGQPGTAAVIPRELNGCNCIDLIIIRQPHTGDSEYLCRYLESDAAVSQFLHGSGGAIQQHFNVSAAQDLVVPVPPFEEQIAIREFVQNEMRTIDNLVEEAYRAKDLLLVRRGALITAAVTGQIDVRGLAPAETA
jgi:type I restriction enzyme S subunit